MAFQKNCFPCSTWRKIMFSLGPCLTVVEHLWQNLTWEVLAVMFQSILMFTICLAWSGEAIYFCQRFGSSFWVTHCTVQFFFYGRLARMDSQTKLQVEFSLHLHIVSSQLTSLPEQHWHMQHLSHDKLTCIAAVLKSWSAKQQRTRKELESLVGPLQHVYQGHSSAGGFFKRMMNLLSAFQWNDHLITH